MNFEAIQRVEVRDEDAGDRVRRRQMISRKQPKEALQLCYLFLFHFFCYISDN